MVGYLLHIFFLENSRLRGCFSRSPEAAASIDLPTETPPASVLCRIGCLGSAAGKQ